jgi:hypothetical protein
MRITLFFNFLFCILFGISTKSQTYLLCQGNSESLYLSEPSTNNSIIISKDAFGKLVGYELNKDTLTCYFEIRGKIKIRNYVNPVFNQVEKYPIVMKPDFEEKNISTKQFFFNEYMFQIDYLVTQLFKNNELKWSNYKGVTNNSIDTTRVNYLSGYCHPQVSPKLDKILIEMMDTRMFVGGKNRLYEIDFQTGEHSFIAKGRNGSYSIDGRYILYENNVYANNYYVYDKMTKKKLDNYNGIQTAFWLHK